MALKSRNAFPPSGWMYYQPETNWQSNPHVGFNDVVQQIIDHRKANPRFNLSTDVGTVERELEQYTEARLRSQFGDAANEYLAGPPGAPPSFTPPRLRRHQDGVVAGGVAKAQRIRAGIGLMLDWLGDSLKPVEQGLANSRAAVCLNCPFNKRVGALQSVTIGVVADGVHKLMEEKSEMKLATPDDSQLHTCSLCDCVLTLKVWTPTEHVKKHTDDALKNSLPDHCWVKKEIST